MLGLNKRLARNLTAIFTLLTFWLSPVASWACSGIAIGKNASANGNPVLSRTDDYGNGVPQLFVVNEAGKYKKGETWEDWNGFTHTWRHDSYKFTGTPDMPFIPESGIDHRYLDGNGVNEKGLAVTGMNTTSRKAEVSGPTGLDPTVSSGFHETHMAMILLAECATAIEAVEYAGQIVETQGAAQGAVISIGDKDGIWLFETLSGHRWVASRVPDDKYCIVANNMLHGAVDLSDTANFRGSSDVEDFAIDNGFAVYDSNGKVHIAASYGNIYSESSTYRRWRGYNLFSPSQNILPIDRANDRYPATVSGDVISLDRRILYEMYVEPDAGHKITPLDIMKLFGDRYKGVEPIDYKAAPFNNPYGAVVDIDCSTVNNTYATSGAETDPYEVRPLGVLTSSTTHFYEMPSNYPAEIGSRFWICMGPAEFGLHLPFYGLITDTHEYYKNEIGSWGYNPESAYWIFHDLSRKSRLKRVEYGAAVKEFWTEYERKLIAEQDAVEAKMLELYAEDPAAAKEYITNYTIETAGEAMRVAKIIRDSLSDFMDSGETGSFVIPEIQPKPTPDGGGSSGCDVGFGVMALLGLTGLAFLRKKD